MSNRKNDNGTMDEKSVLLHSLNAPAKITNQEFYYVAVKKKKNGEEEVVETIPWRSLPTSGTLYPSEKLDYQVYEPYDFENKILADPNNILRRRVRIDYKELSSCRTYYFEGNWDYNRQYNVWVDKSMFGN